MSEKISPLMGQQTRDLLKAARPSSLSYDADDGLFLLGGQQVTPAEFAQRELRGISAEADLTEEEVDELVQDHSAAITFRRPLILPKLHAWLEYNKDDDRVFDETRQVMREVFVQLRPDMSHVDSSPGGFMGFRAELSRNDSSHLFLQTLGNCACWSVGEFGPFGSRYWHDGVTYLTPHNVDTNEQRAALFAGLGHLARRAAS